MIKFDRASITRLIDREGNWALTKILTSFYSEGNGIIYEYELNTTGSSHTILPEIKGHLQ